MPQNPILIMKVPILDPLYLLVILLWFLTLAAILDPLYLRVSGYGIQLFGVSVTTLEEAQKTGKEDPKQGLGLRILRLSGFGV